MSKPKLRKYEIKFRGMGPNPKIIEAFGFEVEGPWIYFWDRGGEYDKDVAAFPYDVIESVIVV